MSGTGMDAQEPFRADVFDRHLIIRYCTRRTDQHPPLFVCHTLIAPAAIMLQSIIGAMKAFPLGPITSRSPAEAPITKTIFKACPLNSLLLIIRFLAFRTFLVRCSQLGSGAIPTSCRTPSTTPWTKTFITWTIPRHKSGAVPSSTQKKHR